MAAGRRQALFANSTYDQVHAAYAARINGANEYLWNTGNQIKQCFFGGALDVADFILTDVRLWIVYDMMLAWGTNNDVNHPDSRVNTVAHNRNDAGQYTNWEWGFGLLTLASLGIGIYREYYIQKHKDELRSTEYLAKQREKARKKYFAAPENNTLKKTPAEVDVALEDLARNRWAKFERAQDGAQFIFPDQIEATVKTNIKNDRPFVHFFLQNPTGIFARLNTLKGLVGNYSFVFWIVWMSVAGIAGIPFVNSLPGLPLVTFAAISIASLAYAAIWKFGAKRPESTRQNDTDKLMEQIQAENPLRLFLKDKHQFFKSKLETILVHYHARNARRAEQEFPKVYGIKQTERHAPRQRPRPIPARGNAFRRLLAYTKNSGYRMLNDVVMEATLTFFSLWLLIFVFLSLNSVLTFATVIPYVTPFLQTLCAQSPIAASLVSFGAWASSWGLAAVSHPTITMVLGIGAGAIRGCYTYAAQALESMVYEETLNTKANQAYKPHRVGERPTNEKAFNQLLADVTELKRQVSFIQREIAKKAGNKPQNLALAFIKDYSLADINVTNDYMYDHYQASRGKWSTFKTWLLNTYKFIAGAQTWIFNLRNVGLPTGAGVLVSAVAMLGNLLFMTAGPMKGFLLLAGVLGVIGGTLRLGQHKSDTAHQKKEAFLAYLGSRIGSLRQAKVELSYIVKLYNLSDEIPAGDINPFLDPRPRPGEKPVAKPSVNGQFAATRQQGVRYNRHQPHAPRLAMGLVR